MIKVWLTFNNMAEVFQLPVPPSEFTVTKENQVTTLTIQEIGEIALLGKPKLTKIDFSSFFPAQEYPFCQYTGFPTPDECIQMIDKWSESSKPIRLIITGTNINIPVEIESFTHSMKSGSEDVYFSLSLKEYKFLTATDVLKSTTASATQRSRTSEKTTASKTNTETKYTVKKGDTLWLIAKKELGDGSKYPQIKSKNSLKSDTIYAGQVLRI